MESDYWFGGSCSSPRLADDRPLLIVGDFCKKDFNSTTFGWCAPSPKIGLSHFCWALFIPWPPLKKHKTLTSGKKQTRSNQSREWLDLHRLRRAPINFFIFRASALARLVLLSPGAVGWRSFFCINRSTLKNTSTIKKPEQTFCGYLRTKGRIQQWLRVISPAVGRDSSDSNCIKAPPLKSLDMISWWRARGRPCIISCAVEATSSWVHSTFPGP